METLSLEARRALVAGALAAADAKPNAERIRLPWRASETLATVVELPVDQVLLNPHSHRIRAQLESSLDRELVEQDPYGAEAQKLIADLLRGAKAFADLRVNLKDSGQLEPGVVTADGVLVNANTRCVALRDNRSRYIRAAVLPPDSAQAEIDRLELRLQMKRDFHSDYTFTNELLFIDDLVKQYGFRPDEIAVEMGWASRTDAKALNRATGRAQCYLRMLALIRELQHLSGDRLPVVFFDDAFQALLELDEKIEELKASDFVAAQELRDARLVGLLAGAGYRELRWIDASFLENHLVPAMEDRPALRPHVDSLTRRGTPAPTDADPMGLDVLDALQDLPSADRRSAAPLLELLLGSVNEKTVTVPASSGPPLDRLSFCNELRLAIVGATEDVKLERDAGDFLNRPLELIRRAIKQTRAALEAVSEVEHHPEFEADRVRAVVLELGMAQADLLAKLTGEPEA